MNEASSVALPPGSTAPPKSALHEKMGKSPGLTGSLLFGVVLLTGLGYAGFHLVDDLSGTHLIGLWPWILLVTALVIALGFEFVNGFHDTANAVATVIYTHSLEPNLAVIWSGTFNFLGVLV